MAEDVKKDLCNCDPEGSPDHNAAAHDDEHNGPGVVGWKNPLAGAPEGADYEDTLDSAHGPGVPVNEGPGVKK